jgi:hypothetical protein
MVLDDLLHHEEEQPATARSGPSALGWLARSALIAAGLAGVGVLGLRSAGIGVPFLLAFTGLLSLLVLRQVLGWVVAPPPTRASARRSAGHPEDGLYHWGNPDGLRTAINRWETRLDWSQGQPERFARTVQPRLGEIVDERLRQRHGFTRRTEPVRARALLGDPLWTFLEGPLGKAPTPRELAAVIAVLEAL